MNYALPLIILCVAPAFFLALGRRGYAAFGVAQNILRCVVAIPLLVSGFVLHFFRMQTTASMIPPGFPAPHLLVIVTGVFEILGAVGLFVPAWRRVAGLCLVLLMIAVFPANIYAAGKFVGGVHMPGVLVRTGMQVIYIWLILLSSHGLPGERFVRNSRKEAFARP